MTRFNPEVRPEVTRAPEPSVQPHVDTRPYAAPLGASQRSSYTPPPSHALRLGLEHTNRVATLTRDLEGKLSTLDSQAKGQDRGVKARLKGLDGMLTREGTSDPKRLAAMREVATQAYESRDSGFLWYKRLGDAMGVTDRSKTYDALIARIDGITGRQPFATIGQVGLGKPKEEFQYPSPPPDEHE